MNDIISRKALLEALKDATKIKDCDSATWHIPLIVWEAIKNAPEVEAEPVIIKHSKDGVYDVFVGEQKEWAISRNSADNVFAWLAEQGLIRVQFIDEVLPQLRCKDGWRE